MGDRPAPHAEPLTLPTQNPKAAARVIAGEAMILTPQDSVLHTLNPVATRIWELLAERLTLGELVAALISEFEIDPETAEVDARELVAALVEKGVLVG